MAARPCPRMLAIPNPSARSPHALLTPAEIGRADTLAVAAWAPDVCGSTLSALGSQRGWASRHASTAPSRPDARGRKASRAPSGPQRIPITSGATSSISPCSPNNHASPQPGGCVMGAVGCSPNRSSVSRPAPCSAAPWSRSSRAEVAARVAQRRNVMVTGTVKVASRPHPRTMSRLRQAERGRQRSVRGKGAWAIRGRIWTRATLAVEQPAEECWC